MTADGPTWRDQVVAPQDAVSIIRPGDHVFGEHFALLWGVGAGRIAGEWVAGKGAP